MRCHLSGSEAKCDDLKLRRGGTPKAASAWLAHGTKVALNLAAETPTPPPFLAREPHFDSSTSTTSIRSAEFLRISRPKRWLLF